MGSLLLMSLSITLGFVFGAYWKQSGEELPVTRELYNKIIIASMTWWTTSYRMVKQYFPSSFKKDEESVKDDNI